MLAMYLDITAGLRKAGRWLAIGRRTDRDPSAYFSQVVRASSGLENNGNPPKSDAGGRQTGSHWPDPLEGTRSADGFDNVYKVSTGSSE
jgi:hypothetical protein